MTEHDRNMRTLITSFVIAVLSLTVLRFVEVGNVSTVSSAHVLGVETNEVILPNAEVSNIVLQANYIAK